MSSHLSPKDDPEQHQQVFVRTVENTITVTTKAVVGLSAYIVENLNLELRATERESRNAMDRSDSHFSKLIELIVLRRRWGRGGQPLPEGHRLMRLTDWVPSAAVRKRQKKLIADEIAEINEFRAEGRLGVARWRRVWLALHWTRYLLGAPFASAVRLFRKTSAG